MGQFMCSALTSMCEPTANEQLEAAGNSKLRHEQACVQHEDSPDGQGELKTKALEDLRAMPQAEFQSYLRKLFDVADVRGNGILSLVELADLLRGCIPNLRLLHMGHVSEFILLLQLSSRWFGGLPRS